ncbi:MAG TPA: hypothetical protein PKG54_09530 [Phycisphaerae bacterium]|jgi:hypothetical protein|nr:hypothetical protein [Phycisphaerae bacterium]HOB74755.1 hypothetical protein [Phycisphaerae bacterium]HOJ55241.1 hypothetical protein [Phycisphaerae bacterium]HOL27767.1 hypothetical protein [Phycisphaerae bacterium]HPP22693.1 hypothetical protein [Phycisphaerae bacterium]
MTRKKHGAGPGQDPESLAPGSDLPEPYPGEEMIPPEAPGDLDPSETPIVSDSPRRALSAGRFGNPRKEELADQSPNSDSVTDDEPMESTEERSMRDVDFPEDVDPTARPPRTPRRKE